MSVNWSQVFAFDTSPLELFVRGTVMYLTLFALLRILPRRQPGIIGVADLLVVVLLADASQNAMSGGYVSVPDGILLVGTIIFWSWAIDWLGYHVPRLERLFYPPPLPLVKDGQMLRRNMHRELITEEELMTQLRHQGIERIEDVKQAYMEADGRISVIPRSGVEIRPGQRPVL